MMITIHVIIIIIHVGCSFGQPTKKCSSDVCDSSVCTNYPNAVCYPDECADCSPRYFIGNSEVTNVCGKLLLLYKKFLVIKNTIKYFFISCVCIFFIQKVDLV